MIEILGLNLEWYYWWGIWKFGPIAIVTVCKFGYQIFNHTDIPDTEEIHGEYQTMNEAEYKTFKRLSKEEIGRKIEIDTDKEGNKIFTVISEVMIWIFIPIKYTKK